VLLTRKIDLVITSDTGDINSLKYVMNSPVIKNKRVLQSREPENQVSARSD